MLSEEHVSEPNGQRLENLANHLCLSNKAGDTSENICGSNGIFSHEVLLNGETERDSKVMQCNFKSKVKTLYFNADTELWQLSYLIWARYCSTGCLDSYPVVSYGHSDWAWRFLLAYFQKLSTFQIMIRLGTLFGNKNEDVCWNYIEKYMQLSLRKKRVLSLFLFEMCYLLEITKTKTLDRRLEFLQGTPILGVIHFCLATMRNGSRSSLVLNLRLVPDYSKW